MQLGVLIMPDRRWSAGASRWQLAEELGFAAVWTYDHIWWRGLRDEPWFAAVPTLSAAAAVTSRIGLGLMVGSPNFRHPVTLAKEAVALDDISSGRFTLGVGAGAPSAGDAEVLGGPVLSPVERAERFAEFVELTGTLLNQQNTSWEGKHYSAREARMIPGSVQSPRLPLAVAASGRSGIELAAGQADAWITAGPADWLGNYTPDECFAAVQAQRTRLDQACESAGRDPGRLQKIMIATPMCGNPMESVQACRVVAERAAEAGMTQLVLHWPREQGMYAGDLRVLEAIATELNHSEGMK